MLGGVEVPVCKVEGLMLGVKGLKLFFSKVLLIGEFFLDH